MGADAQGRDDFISIYYSQRPLAQEREFTNTKSNNNGGKLLNLNQIYFFEHSSTI